MTEAQLYERLGRMTLAIEAKDRAYTELLGLTAKIVSGEIDRGRVLINLTDERWEFSEPGTSPAMPAQINGKPECVIAPPERSEGPFIKDGHEVVVTGRDFKIEPVG